MYTIKEATDRICPMRRDTGEEPQNRDTYCAGDKCMAWRWAKDANRDREGYCGLAGNPS